MCRYVLISLAMFCQVAYTQSPIQPASANTNPSPVEVMKKTVVFIEADCGQVDSSGKQAISSHAGTGFLLAVPDPRLNGGSFTYLVTNRHVAQPGVELNHPCSPFRYILRLDTKTPNASGSYSTLAFLSPQQLPWTYSPDRSVDLAVTPIGLNLSNLDVAFLPSTLLLSDSEIKQNSIQEGDSVLFTGLFVQLVGQTHSEPIVREGKIAMLPKEPVPTTLGPIGDVLLVDCHVFGGNSGSPMFVNLAGQRGGNLIVGLNYRLLGVVSGYVKETSDFVLQAVAAYAGTMDANSGVAVVVPAQKLLDLLDSPSLKESREQELVHVKTAKK